MKLVALKTYRLDLSKEDLLAAIAAYAKMQIPPDAEIQAPNRSTSTAPLVEVRWSEPA